MKTPDTRLVADVGGTNTRLAVFDQAKLTFRSVAQFTNRDYDSLQSIIDYWLKGLEEAAPRAACIAVAAPPSTEHVTMINIGWSFSCRALARQFGFQHLTCINDFQANAHALPHLDADDLEQLHAGSKGRGDGLCTVGPGTGLGGANLRYINGRPIAFAAEPGHMGLSPGSEMEFAIFELLLRRHGNIYAELLVSGNGLVLLYRTIAELAGISPESMDPADVSRRGLEGSDAQCVQALQVFCALLGSVCGDFVLANGCYGGLYLAGGIVPRMATFLRSSDFLKRLHEKGAMGDHLQAMPVYIITADNPGLIGAAHAPLQSA